MTRTFLLEIGTEEIPAGYLPPASAALSDAVSKGFEERRLAFESVRTYATPRRLIAVVEGLADRQTDLDKEVMGPPSRAAFAPDGTLTKAGEGFARSQGVAPDTLKRVNTEKGEYVAAQVHETGKAVAEVLSAWLPEVVTGIAFPKTMKWRDEDLRFARPIRWLVALLDAEVLPVTVGPLTAGRATYGHRLVNRGPVDVPRAGDILTVLEEIGVIADPAARRARIEREVTAAAKKAGGAVIADPQLLEEVSYLVELPSAVLGSFDREFLKLPAEIIITAMKSHQRYFALADADGKLLPNFITIANGRWADDSQVAAGNERVLRARLADARFYWDTDLKAGLDTKRQDLKNVVWLEGAGTVWDRSERIAALVGRLGARFNVSADEAKAAARAAELAKADLATEMIKDGKEFTSLQGVVGSEYARASGEPDAVVMGIREHYAPRGPSDPLPSTVPGLLISLADRFDALAGCFAMGLIPSGSQDPYALRRAANGIMRIVMEKGWHVTLSDLCGDALAALPDTAFAKAKGGRDGVRAQVLDFLRDRLAWHLRESGIAYDAAAATLAASADDPVDARARAAALSAIRGEADLEKLVVGFKRAANILKGVDEEVPALTDVMMSGAEPAELALRSAVTAAQDEIEAAMKAVDYPRAVKAFLTLRAPIDGFFEGVMVMSKDDTERKRRLALLRETKALFDRLYDLTQIVVEG